MRPVPCDCLCFPDVLPRIIVCNLPLKDAPEASQAPRLSFHCKRPLGYFGGFLWWDNGGWLWGGG